MLAADAVVGRASGFEMMFSSMPPIA